MTSLLFLSTFLFALLGASGTVPAYRDSGDLVASIYTLGIAHPPGYALYVLVGKLFTLLLPFGNVAYRVNAMSAFFAAATAVVCFRSLRSAVSRESVWVPLAAAVLLVSTPAFLALSRVAEMYTLSAFIAAAIVALLLSDHPKASAGAALLLGLGLSVHPTLLFLAPLFLARPRETFRASTILYLALGLSVFLYLPLRASMDPALNWGDPSHWRNFWRVVTRADYGGLKLHPVQSVFAWTPASLGSQTAFFFKSFGSELGWGGLLLGAAGVIHLFRSPRPPVWGWGLLASWVLSGPAFVILSNLPLQEASTPAILQPYLLIPLILWLPFLLSGADLLKDFCKGQRFVPVAALGVVLVLKPWVWASERHDYYAYDYARNLLRMLPPKAVLFDPDDPTHFTVQTLQKLEKRRPDVTLLSFYRTRWGYEQLKMRSPELFPAIPISNAQELEQVLWNYSARQRPFYAELPSKLGAIPYRVEGLVYAAQVGTPKSSSSESRAIARARLEETICRGHFVATAHRDFFLQHLIDYYAAAHTNLGLEYAAAREWPAATAQYERALEMNPAQTAALNNLGIVAFARGDYAAAKTYFDRGLAFEPNNEMLQKNALLAGQKMAKNL